MPAPTDSIPANAPASGAELGESPVAPAEGSQPLAALPVNLAEHAAGTTALRVGATTREYAPPDRRVLMAITLASAVLFFAVFASALRLMGFL
jgi:hypothetical protein